MGIVPKGAFPNVSQCPGGLRGAGWSRWDSLTQTPLVFKPHIPSCPSRGRVTSLGAFPTRIYGLKPLRVLRWLCHRGPAGPGDTEGQPGVAPAAATSRDLPSSTRLQGGETSFPCQPPSDLFYFKPFSRLVLPRDSAGAHGVSPRVPRHPPAPSLNFSSAPGSSSINHPESREIKIVTVINGVYFAF